MRERSNSYIEESQTNTRFKKIHNNKSIPILNSSVNITKDDNKIDCGEISRSAPTNLTSHYVGNYITINTLHRTNSISRLGDSIPVNTPPPSNYLSNSIQSFRKLFWGK